MTKRVLSFKKSKFCIATECAPRSVSYELYKKYQVGIQNNMVFINIFKSSLNQISYNCVINDKEDAHSCFVNYAVYIREYLNVFGYIL